MDGSTNNRAWGWSPIALPQSCMPLGPQFKKASSYYFQVFWRVLRNFLVAIFLSLSWGMSSPHFQVLYSEALFISQQISVVVEQILECVSLPQLMSGSFLSSWVRVQHCSSKWEAIEAEKTLNHFRDLENNLSLPWVEICSFW